MMREEDEERDRKRKEEKERKEREAREKAEKEAASRTPEQNKALEIKEKANQLYTKKQFTEALALYEECRALDPNNILYINNMSGTQPTFGSSNCDLACYLENGDLVKARELAEEAVDLGREHRADFTLIARALTRIGSTYMKEEDYEKAIEYFKKSLLEHRNANTLNLQKKAEKLLEEKKAKEYYNPELSQKHKEEGNEFFKKQKYE